MKPNITISLDPQKKRLLKMLAPKLGYSNVSQYLNALLDSEIAKHLADDELAINHGGEDVVVSLPKVHR